MTGNDCKVKQTANLINAFLTAENYCSVCRRHFKQILDHLARIQTGSGSRPDLLEIRDLASKVTGLCQCGGGKSVAEQVMANLQAFRDEFIIHIENHVCPAGECPQLVLAPCQAACPAGLDIPNYVALVGMQQYEEALARIREDVPLPGSLGRICEHPCERACRRGQVDKPISICALKGLAYDKSNQQPGDLLAPPARKFKERVAVIGAGPAGLSAAYFLAQRGYGVTIFEAMPEPGGMLAYGIPPYRLPRQVLRDEIARIKALGVEIKVNTPVSNIQALKKEGFDAIFLGTGAWQGSIPIANDEEFKGVFDGVTFLRTVNQQLLQNNGTPEIDLTGKQVVVVGGGNVAIDAARVSLRLGAEEVKIIYRRTREEMPALVEEIVDAEHEGVKFDFLVSPVGLGGQNGWVAYIECLKNELSEPDASGRRKPVPIAGSAYRIAADVVIFATGQQPDLSILHGTGAEVARNRIVVNPLTLETSLPGVFAGGDAVTGPASAIKAMAAGKQAAASIHAFLRGEVPTASIKFPVKRPSIPPRKITAEQKAQASQVNFHELYMAEKKDSFAEIMQGISEAAAMAEANRCLRCDLCIACGQCVDSCHNRIGAAALQLGYIKDAHGETDFARPGDKCIGCGTCSVNCPTGAITQEDRNGFREMRMCGSLMSRLELVNCQVCGQPFATEKHLDYINSKDKQVCPACSRQVWSRNVYGRWRQ
ncbi:Glutamate synthase (NADPH) [Desulfotomaculum nigrificans CO-1-SRB]|uniref:Glutamate synthase (NADPH) n=1 Tax=Desulfotomaculum nigrificans (strain DSM 14880 / VKM B-2319 / CO-1-SRB) TaxID=868595 RepID=F6B2M4_DESCC|nr:FAD-dependent oxidoreductase [Desulfotomaculum nigrificans]AEF93853.1 Glutamate synthase (NADPH) [Desulfotomaculum nigrificans CO-1-SRB]